MHDLQPKTHPGIIRSIGWPLLAGFCLALFSAVLFCWFASEVFEGEVAAFDGRLREWVQHIAGPELTRLMIFVSFLGKPGFLVALGIPIAGVFLWLGWKHIFALFSVTMAGEIILEMTLKGLFQRVRPEPFFDQLIPASYSFPSGHALGSFCFFVILAWLIGPRIKRPVITWSIRVMAIILVAAIGFSRVYLGVHYPSDVLAGYLAGFVWCVTAALGDAFFHRQRSGPGES